MDIVNHDNADVVQSLDEGIPVYMRGGDEYSTNGHAWVCDGYRCIVDYTRYSLFVIPMEDEITELLEWERQDYYRGNTVTYHMNWGWYGNKDGYYFDHRLNMTISNEPVNYSQDRKDLIFSKKALFIFLLALVISFGLLGCHKIDGGYNLKKIYLLYGEELVLAHDKEIGCTIDGETLKL